MSPAKFRINDGYDVARIARHLDFINVMTYDLHGSWDRAADHHAPLNRRDHDDWDPLTTVTISDADDCKNSNQYKCNHCRIAGFPTGIRRGLL